MDDNELVKAEREKELVECLAWLQHCMDEYDDKEAYQDDYKMASIAWNFIRARMAENAELKEAQWVPVSERLPEKYQSVLAARQGYAPNKQHYVCEAWLNDFNWQNSCGTMENVTHWQPLPAAPKGE